MTEPTRKLSGLPPIYIVSIEESAARRQNLYGQLKRFGIQDFYFCVYKRWAEYDWNITGNHIDRIVANSFGPSTSHILTNKFWTENTDHEYALIIEDDIDLSTINLWNFNWLDLFKSLPEDWTCVQLCQIREQPWTMTFHLRHKQHHDLGCQAYLIKRCHAEKMAKQYWREDGFELTVPTCNIRHNDGSEEWVDLFPIVENVVFEGLGTTYNIPLFTEDLTHTQTTNDDGRIEESRYPCRDILLEKITSYSF